VLFLYPKAVTSIKPYWFANQVIIIREDFNTNLQLLNDLGDLGIEIQGNIITQQMI